MAVLFRIDRLEERIAPSKLNFQCGSHRSGGSDRHSCQPRCGSDHHHQSCGSHRVSGSHRSCEGEREQPRCEGEREQSRCDCEREQPRCDDTFKVDVKADVGCIKADVCVSL